MTTGLKTGLMAALALAGLGCKTQPECEPLGNCGGDLLTASTPKVNGIPHREWVVVGEKDGVIQPDFCQDQLQVPPTPLTLLRQPPVTATTRPPDNVTADWCSNIVFKETGEVERFVVWAPPFPMKVGLFTLDADSATEINSGNYKMEITYLQTRPLEFSETCLTSQGVRLTCPALGRRLGEFLAAEANIYDVRCYNPDDPNQGGCECQYDVSFISGPSGRWYAPPGATQITLFDQQFNPESSADYCLHDGSGQDGSLDLTGHDTTALFNQKSYRTMHFKPGSCSDGVQSLGEFGVDCGGVCPAACGTCTDGIMNGDEDGIDCGGSCLGVLCENPGDPKYIANPDLKKTRKAACANGIQEKWEEGVDCGGPCRTADGPKLCPTK